MAIVAHKFYLRPCLIMVPCVSTNFTFQNIKSSVALKESEKKCHKLLERHWEELTSDSIELHCGARISCPQNH